MIDAKEIAIAFPPATAGDIAVINLESARQRSWSRFWHTPQRPGIAEYIVEQEQLTVQFLGDYEGLDRLETLANQLVRVDEASMRTALIHAQIASLGHRFAEARDHLAQALALGAPSESTSRLSLSIDQACGTNLEAVLQVRNRMAAESGRLEDLLPLGALLADLREFDEAERIYCRALREYQDVSPFAVAWVCFQLGVLYGELLTEANSSKAAWWYRKAIEYLPGYVKARVHLAEIYLGCRQIEEAESVLIPASSSGDPEVRWRLAEVINASGRPGEAKALMGAAHADFRILLEKHLLAFADHGAEFFSGGGMDIRQALELARVNLANRPTLRAFEQAYAIAVQAGEKQSAAEILVAAADRCGRMAAFSQSPLVTQAVSA
jgi:hypothetical protein